VLKIVCAREFGYDLGGKVVAKLLDVVEVVAGLLDVAEFVDRLHVEVVARALSIAVVEVVPRARLFDGVESLDGVLDTAAIEAEPCARLVDGVGSVDRIVRPANARVGSMTSVLYFIFRL
jgi:hypothetical protein